MSNLMNAQSLANAAVLTRPAAISAMHSGLAANERAAAAGMINRAANK